MFLSTYAALDRVSCWIELVLITEVIGLAATTSLRLIYVIHTMFIDLTRHLTL